MTLGKLTPDNLGNADVCSCWRRNHLILQTNRELLFYFCLVSGDNGHSEVPLRAFPTEPDDIGQDVVPFADPTEDVHTEAVKKGGEMLRQGQGFHSPTSRSGVEPVLPVTPSSSDASEGRDKVVYPELSQPAPEEDSPTGARALPATSPAADGAVTVGGTADAAASHVTNGLDLEGAVPEDHSPGLEHVSAAEVLAEVSCGCVDKISAVTAEGAGIHPTTATATATAAAPSSHSSSLDLDSVGLDTSEVSSVSGSGGSGINVPDGTAGEMFGSSSSSRGSAAPWFDYSLSVPRETLRRTRTRRPS